MSGDLRSRAAELVNEYLTSKGNQKFDHVFKDWGGYTVSTVGGGTSCGFPCHWMLWRLGCCDPGLVNRFDAAATLRPGSARYRSEANIAKIAAHPEFKRVYRQAGSAVPSTGDIVLIADDPEDKTYTDEHVLIFLEASAPSYSQPPSMPGRTIVGQWLVAEAGGIRLHTVFRALVSGPTKYSNNAYLLAADAVGKYPKLIVGWLPLDRVFFFQGYEPIPKHMDPLWGAPGLPDFKHMDRTLLLGEWEASDPEYGTIHYIFCKGGQVVVTPSTGTPPILWEGAWVFKGDVIEISWFGPSNGAKEYWNYPLQQTGQKGSYISDKGVYAELTAHKVRPWGEIWQRALMGAFG